MAQYKLVDDTVVSSFQSGLRFFDGVPKPAFDAYRLPLWVKRRGAARLRVYGQVRPLAAGADARWSCRTPRSAPVRSRPWRRSRCARANNAFLRTIPRREGRWRLRWVQPDGSELFSREAVAAAR